MAKLPENTNTTVAAIDRAVVELASDWRRPHLGASLIGRPCDRDLWYTFRWATRPDFSGRMLRLFDRGSREEASFARLLRAAGVTVVTADPQTGKQIQYSVLGGHFAGSLDAMLQGLVEAPKKWHVAEFKTHGAKSFAELTKKGVAESKPEHYAQMQCYMAWAQTDRAYYLAVCKDDDQLHGERVEADPAAYLKLLARAERIIFSDTPPPRISDDPTWYQCKFCAHGPSCHGDQLPEVSCRTCAHATPERNGGWSCAHWRAEIPVDAQKAGCPEHRYIPALVSYATAVDASEADNWIAYQTRDGRSFRNGTKGPDSYSSAELRACPAALIAESGVETLRREFGGTLVERRT